MYILLSCCQQENGSIHTTFVFFNFIIDFLSTKLHSNSTEYSAILDCIISKSAILNFQSTYLNVNIQLMCRFCDKFAKLIMQEIFSTQILHLKVSTGVKISTVLEKNGGEGMRLYITKWTSSKIRTVTLFVLQWARQIN